MWRQILVGLCAVVAAHFSAIGSAGVFAKDLGPSIEVPQGAHVQLLYNGHFSLKVAGGLGLSGTFECTCVGGRGTCEVNSLTGGDAQRFVCLKGKTGTCESGCSMTTGPH